MLIILHDSIQNYNFYLVKILYNRITTMMFDYYYLGVPTHLNNILNHTTHLYKKDSVGWPLKI